MANVGNGVGSNSYHELLKRLNSRNAVNGVVGLGYSDLPSVLRFVEVGYRVIGFDIDTVKSVGLTPQSIAGADCVLIATDHEDFDYELMRCHAQLIVDSRDVYRRNCLNLITARRKHG